MVVRKGGQDDCSDFGLGVGGDGYAVSVETGGVEEEDAEAGPEEDQEVSVLFNSFGVHVVHWRGC